MFKHSEAAVEKGNSCCEVISWSNYHKK